jgi:hypothetical protein
MPCWACRTTTRGLDCFIPGKTVEMGDARRPLPLAPALHFSCSDIFRLYFRAMPRLFQPPSNSEIGYFPATASSIFIETGTLRLFENERRFQAQRKSRDMTLHDVRGRSMGCAVSWLLMTFPWLTKFGKPCLSLTTSNRLSMRITAVSSADCTRILSIIHDDR